MMSVTAKIILDRIALGLDNQVERAIAGTDDPLEQAEISKLQPETLSSEQRKLWDGSNATSMMLRLSTGDVFQVQVIRVPPQMLAQQN